MIFHETKIHGVYKIELDLKTDDRGYFVRNFSKEEFSEHGISFDIMHVNRSLTKRRGTIRGLHLQKSPHEERKIVQCLRGGVYDVVVDLRTDSPTYGQWVGECLNEQNMKMLLVPKGCAHGF